jgi:diguanylate cyclase (GGDEF)-like protein
MMAKLIERKQFNELCIDEISRARRYNRTFSVLLVTIDYGPDSEVRRLLGVSLSKQFAQFLRELLRDLDSVTRLPGEIFAVALPETDPAGAALTAERIRKGTEERSFKGDGSAVRLSVTIGSAGFPEHGPTAPEVMACAQVALEAALAGGGNRVVEGLVPTTE